jgi:two-component system, OmpR family, sensor histidine kinase BaeS
MNKTMKIGITYRLFFVILCATGLTILCLFLIMWWSLDREFYQYIRMIDQDRLAQTISDLGRKYDEKGSWDFLKDTPPRWGVSGDISSSLDPKVGSPPSFKPGINKIGDVRPMLPPFDVKKPNGPLIILDGNKKPVFGFHTPDEKFDFRPIIVRDKTVGYVGLMSPRHFLHPMQVQFLSRQKLALVLGASGMVLVVIIISLPLSRRLVKPIKEIAAATHNIASGRYTSRISISSSNELGQLARDFNAMALTLEKHERERRQWVADISHELRTPIAVLQGEIEALLDGIHTITPETIRSLHAETQRLKYLVEDLYQISLSDLGALTYRKEYLDPLDVLKNSIESYSAEFDRKHISLMLNVSGDAETTGFADRERLNQLFLNLLENSLRYTDAGGKLSIGAQVDNGFLTIEFQDSEPGVCVQDRERLFERFYRVEESRNRESGGAGLGLTICKNIVDAHEGVISAHESPFGGLMIRITLPVLRECP